MSGSCVTDGFDILDNGRAVGLSIIKAIMNLGQKRRA